MNIRKTLSLLLTFAVILSLIVPALAAGEDIVILYTNDIHTYINNNVGEGNENNLTYSKIAALKTSNPNAILVDAGDHLQGTAYGGMDNGATIIELMNSAGYDLATLGNHEFDYGSEAMFAAIAAANHKYISCNFYHEKDGIVGETVLDSYSIIESSGKEIAFIGITTPETIHSTSPTNLKDESGKYIFSFAGGNNGTELYSRVQSAIDDAKAEGADYVIALGHLGVDLSSSPWTSRDVIANTHGLDAFIDGHSHTIIESEEVSDMDGNKVILTQTGSYLDAVGKMTISTDGTITCKLLTGNDLAELACDPQTKAIEDKWIAEIDSSFGQVIGYSEVTLDNYDRDGNRLVRKQETNSGDFAADALYYMFEDMGLEVDAAVVNGGGVRNKAVTGELTYLTCKEIHTFGNIACLVSVTGQQLLDALEMGVSELQPDGTVESGGFLQVSGLSLSVDLTIPSTVQKDENGMWAGSPTGDYRVQELKVLNKETGDYEPIDLNARYNLAGQNYVLRNGGDGYAMLADSIPILDYVAEDYMVLAEYIKSFPVDESTGLPTIGLNSGYADVNGQGRITIFTEPRENNDVIKLPEPTPKPEEEPAKTVYTVLPGDSLWKIAQKHYGNGAQWSVIYKANSNSIKNPNLIFIDQTIVIPAA